MTHSISRNEHWMSSNPHFQVRESPPLSSQLASSSLAASHIVASVNGPEKRKTVFGENISVFFSRHTVVVVVGMGKWLAKRSSSNRLADENFHFLFIRSFVAVISSVAVELVLYSWRSPDRKKNSKKKWNKNEKYFDVREEILRLWKRKIKVWEKRMKKSTQEASEKRKFFRYFTLVRQ